MREYKFRVWDEVNQVMKVPEGIQLIHKYIDSKMGYSFKLENDLVVVMQYTGLKDKNGVEIYEGDIVTKEGGHFVGEVQLAEYTSFGIDAKDEEHIGWVAIRSPDNRKQPLLELYRVEVIGNIYENPELLK